MQYLVFVDIETTGRNPHIHQMYDFYAVPVINGVIRDSLALDLRINHNHYTIEREILEQVCRNVTMGQRPSQTVVNGPEGWTREWLRWVRDIFTTEEAPITLAGHNVGGFDRQFMLQACHQMRWMDDWFNWGVLETGSLYAWPDDIRIPSLDKQRERANNRGAGIELTDDHTTARTGALLAAELYSYHTWDEIHYDRPAKSDPLVA